MADGACVCCGGTDMSLSFDVETYRYVCCGGCGSARLEPLPAADPVDLYGQSYFVGASNGGYLDYDADAEMHRRNARARLDRVMAHLPRSSGTRLLDVGCASGYVLDEAQRRGWIASGVDASPFARGRASERGHRVDATVDEAVAAAPPNIATFFQVLEHMADPRGAIAATVNAMQPGSLVAIETWDVSSRIARLFGRRWQQANPPSVIHLFSAKGVRLMLEGLGLEVISVAPTSKLVSVGLVAGVAAHRWGVAGRTMRSVAEATRLTKVVVPYRLGDLITVIAVKPR